MTNQELQTGKSFESMLENHSQSSVVGMSYAHGYLVGLINIDYLQKKAMRDLCDGSFVIVPNTLGNMEPTQVNYLQGEPTDFGTPVATVRQNEFMVAAKLAYGMEKKIIGVPTWSHDSHDTKIRVLYQIYIEGKSTVVKEDSGLDGTGTAARVHGILNS